MWRAIQIKSADVTPDEGLKHFPSTKPRRAHWNVQWPVDAFGGRASLINLRRFLHNNRKAEQRLNPAWNEPGARGLPWRRGFSYRRGAAGWLLGWWWWWWQVVSLALRPRGDQNSAAFIWLIFHFYLLIESNLSTGRGLRPVRVKAWGKSFFLLVRLQWRRTWMEARRRLSHPASSLSGCVSSGLSPKVWPKLVACFCPPHPRGHIIIAVPLILLTATEIALLPAGGYFWPRITFTRNFYFRISFWCISFYKILIWRFCLEHEFDFSCKRPKLVIICSISNGFLKASQLIDHV